MGLDPTLFVINGFNVVLNGFITYLDPTYLYYCLSTLSLVLSLDLALAHSVLLP